MMKSTCIPQSAPDSPVADLVLHHVCLGYGATTIARDIHGEFTAGSMTAIVGPNGAGKSTLLKGLMGLLRPLRGTIISRHPRRALGYLAQANEIETQFPISVEDFVAVGLWSHIGCLRGTSRLLIGKVVEAIAAVGLQDQASHWIDELSGGQFQRMRFARLLVQDPPVILLDEPFAGVDEPTTEVLLQCLHAWHAQGKTVIAVLHDREIVQAHFEQTLALEKRGLTWGETRSLMHMPTLARAGA